MSMSWARCVGFAIILLMIGNCSIYAEPINLSIEKEKLVAYHDSGQYLKDIAAVVKHAQIYLSFRLNQIKQFGSKKKLAVVMAVDETALSNYPDMEQASFGGTQSQILANERLGHDKALAPMLDLYQQATNNNVDIFFISNRPESLRKATQTNLICAGFARFSHLYLRPANFKGNNQAYKQHVRKTLINQGYDIAVNIGDQYSDIKGGYADMAFKLANPYYLTA